MTPRNFPDNICLTVLSGIMLCDRFEDMHHCLTVLAGGPVWTHQMPRIGRAMRPQLAALWPDLAAVDLSEVKDPETFAVWKAKHPELFERSRLVSPLPGNWLADPIAEGEQTMPGKEIVVVSEGKP